MRVYRPKSCEICGPGDPDAQEIIDSILTQDLTFDVLVNDDGNVLTLGY